MNTTTETSTRQRICAVAAGLFAEKGFAGVSMRDIAEGVGIKAASLYNHFADKEQLYLGALEDGFADRVQRIQKAVDSEGTAEERLRETVVALARVSAEDTVARKLLLRELLDGDPARLDRMTRVIFKQPYDRMTKLFGEVVPGGDRALTTAYVNALIMGYFLLLPVFGSLDTAPFPTDPESVGNQVTDMLLESIRAGAI
ncbi:MAG: TetR/AcrR family transcriptional regulator [Proteobacteria bacterium]|nr:TetR/AcrR family transcriptional regulator [Pseudomonadota bacterium]